MKAEFFRLTEAEAAKTIKTMEKLYADLKAGAEKRAAAAEKGEPGPKLVNVHFERGQLLTGEGAWRRDHGGRRPGVGKKK